MAETKELLGINQEVYVVYVVNIKNKSRGSVATTGLGKDGYQE